MRFLLFIPCLVWGQVTETQVDAVVMRSMEAFQVPGVAVGLVQDGQVSLTKGYGVLEVGKEHQVDEKTLFGIASLSKAFTCAAIAMLAEQGKLSWSDRVVDHLSNFQLFDPYVTREFQIVDLVTHRSGLPLGAGDLMMFPQSDFTKDEILANLRHLKPTSSFRSQFDYDNLLYLVAGEIIAKVSGKSWEDFIQDEFLSPLQMADSSPSFAKVKSNNVISPHSIVAGEIAAIDRFVMDMLGPAGGIYSNAENMTHWIQFLIQEGQYEGQTLLESDTVRSLFEPKTLLGVSRQSEKERKMHFRAYSLGWVVHDEFGYKVISHTGGLPGNVCKLTLVPELGLGLIVLLNAESGDAFSAITDDLMWRAMGQTFDDPVAKRMESKGKREAQAKKIEDEVEAKLKTEQAVPPALESVQGTYKDAWYGDVFIEGEPGQLWIRFSRTEKLKGPLSYVQGNTFVVRWTDRSLHADAFVTFSLNHEGQVDGFTMKAVSPLTDFSYDFHHLDLKKQK